MSDIIPRDSECETKSVLDNRKELLIMMEENALIKYVLYLSKYQKTVFICLQGEIDGTTLGISLAADFQFVGESMEFVCSYKQMGIPPNGGLCYYLPKYVGQQKASEILFLGHTIPASHAYKLGIVTDVFPDQDFEAHCIEKAKALTDLPLGVIQGIKALNHANIEELEFYLKKEYEFIEYL
jgi:2-(1,2-epoxy-1,2-dihydrophenyl)acetyl-CoA isomerase